MSKIGIIQPHFFPWLGFYCLLKEVDILVWLDDVQINQRSFHNRVQVNTPHGLNWINVLYNKNLPREKRIFRDLETSKKDNWKEKNLNLLKEGYSVTKNFELIKKIYEETVNEKSFLNILIKSCLLPAKLLNAYPKKIFFSSSLNFKSSSSNLILEIAKGFKAKEYITGHGSFNYLKHNDFEAEGIRVSYLDYNINPWSQPLNYINPYVSVLDFLSCTSDIKDYQLNYKTIYWKEFTKKC
tara:strand:- start:251 stop:970 length:720 start_codon:yes stop_codon:yes gene_type:complete